MPVALIERAKYYRAEWLHSGLESLRLLCQADVDEAFQQISFSQMSLFAVDHQMLQAELLADAGQRADALELVQGLILPSIQSMRYQMQVAAASELRQRLEIQRD